MVLPGGGMRPEEEWPTLSIVEEYDPATDTWRKVTDMKTSRSVFATSVANGKIYAIGGGCGSGPEPLVEEYTPEGWQPEVVSPQGKLPTKWGQVK